MGLHKVTVDFETRSYENIKVGAWNYSKHPTTEVMVLSWKYNDDDELRTWHPAYPHLDIQEEGKLDLHRLFYIIKNKPEVLFEAHNAFFEQCIWLNVCVEKLGWPPIEIQRWRCSAAKASMHGLPRNLENACLALGTMQQKDMVGSRIMKKCCKPKKIRGTDEYEWHESIEDFEILWEYNRQDVRAEEEFSDQLEDLTPLEQRMWFMDQEINFRGVLCDRLLAQKALDLVAEQKKRNNKRFREITTGNTTQRELFKTYCWLSDIDLPDTTSETVTRRLKAHEDGEAILPDDIVEAMKLFHESNRTSTAKYGTALKVMDRDDDRIRGSLMYWGAERTARWAGRLIQPHNFPRGHIADMDAACDFILENDLDTILSEMNLYSKKDSQGNLIGFTDIVEFLSHALRGLLISSEGKEYAVSDFSAIEARVLFWLSDESEAIKVIRSGECIYCDMATTIYNYPCNKKEHPDERQMGKQAILGLGFTMGDVKFIETCDKYNIPITEELAQKVVKAYRGKYPKVVRFWKDQEDAALWAMMIAAKRTDYETITPNSHLIIDKNGWVVAGKIKWKREGKFLKCMLPSGRCNMYPFPALEYGVVYYFKAVTKGKTDRWVTVTNEDANKVWPRALVIKKAKAKALKSNVKLVSEQYFDREKPSLVYMGVIAKTNKWGKIHTYSGKITENIVQGTARDLLAEAMLRTHEEGTYEVALSVHDELITEVEEWLGDLEEFNQLMATIPDWAVGCPINAEGWRGTRYRK